MSFADWLYIPPNMEEYEEMRSENNDFRMATPELLEKVRMVRELVAVTQAWEKDLKSALMSQMLDSGLTSVSDDDITAVYVPESVSMIVDSKKLKETYSDVWKDCQKESKRSATVRIVDNKKEGGQE